MEHRNFLENTGHSTNFYVIVHMKGKMQEFWLEVMSTQYMQALSTVDAKILGKKLGRQVQLTSIRKI